MSTTKVDAKVLQKRVRELAGIHNGYRQLGAVLGYDHAYLFRLGRGEKTEPGDELLGKLGLRRVISFEPVRASGVQASGTPSMREALEFFLAAWEGTEVEWFKNCFEAAGKARAALASEQLQTAVELTTAVCKPSSSTAAGVGDTSK